jgi:hypothetical protein
MLPEASFDVSTAPAVRSDVRPDEFDNAPAINFSAAVLCVTVCSTAAASARKA